MSLHCRAALVWLAWLLVCQSAWQVLAQTEPAAAKSSPAAVRQYRDAVAFQNRAVYDLAADEWQKFLEDYPKDPLAAKAQHYLGVCKLQLKLYDDAVVAFEKVIKTYPSFELLETTYLNLGVTQYTAAQTGKGKGYPAAATTFATLLEKFPQSASADQGLFYLGESLYALGRKAEAEHAYAQLIEKHPESRMRADGLYAAGVAREELGKPDSAGAAYDSFIKEFPAHPLRAEVIMRRGETLFALGKYGTAAKWFASAAASKNFALADYATLRRAASAYEQKQYAEAAELYASIPQSFPTSKHIGTATLAAGNCYYLAGDVAHALPWLTKARALGGEASVEASHWLARLLIKQGQAAEALATVDSAMPQASRSPLAVNLLLDRADALYEQPERRGEALTLYEKVANEHGQHAVAPQALYMAGFTALGQGEYKKAHALADAFRKKYVADKLAPDVEYLDAEALVQLGNHAQAERLYSDLIAKHANHADRAEWQVRRLLAILLQKRHSEVASEAQSLVGALGQPKLVAEAQHLRGMALAELGQHEAALAAFQASLAAAPDWREADETLLHMAAAQRQLGKTNEAIETLRRMLAQFPKSNLLDRAHYRLGEYAYATGNYRESAAQYQHTLKQWPDSSLAAHTLLGLGWTEIAQKDYGTAIQTLGDLVTKYPQHTLAPRARYARAVARQQLKQFSLAAEDIKTYLASNPPPQEKSDALYLQGLCEAGMNRAPQAAATFQAIIDSDPKYPGFDKVLYELAWAHKSAGKEKESMATFARLAMVRPDSPLAAEALYHVGEARYRAADYAKAAEAYQAALAKAGGSDLAEKAAHKLAWSHYQAGQFEAAQQAFTQQIAKLPRGELANDATFMVAECIFKQNKFQEALAAIDKVLARPPANKDFHALAVLHAGQAAAQLGDWQRSLRYLEDGIKQFPDAGVMPELVYEQAWAKQNLGQLDQALPLYEKVANETQREVGARARFMMGEILFERKQHREAVRNFFKVAYGYGYPNAAVDIKKWQASSAYEAGRCFEVMEKLDQAKRSYREVIDKYPTSDKAPLAKGRMEALGA